MYDRTFGRTGRSVSEVGLGCWQLGGDSWGDVSDDDALAILRTAAENGTTFFDTADVYGGGRSEEIISRFLKSWKEPIFVATKLGRWGDPGWPDNFTAAAMRTHTEASLRRLGVQTLDLTQLHCIPAEELERGEVFETLRELKREGKIKAFGASVESDEQALICLRQNELTSLQIIFNLFRQKPIDAIFTRAKEQQVALIVRLPLASGLLSGKMTKETTFSAEDHRSTNRDGQHFNVGETFAGLPYEMGVELADSLKTMVPEGWTLADFALRWILDFGAVSVIIPGASRSGQALSNANSSSLPPLSPEVHARLRSWYLSAVHEHIRGPY